MTEIWCYTLVCSPFLVSSITTGELARPSHAASFTAQDPVARRLASGANVTCGSSSGGLNPTQPPQFSSQGYHEKRQHQGSMVPGNRFSAVFPSPSTSLFPPPPPSLDLAPAESGGCSGSLGRRKAVPPAPPQRTTTLRTDEGCEKPAAPSQVSSVLFICFIFSWGQLNRRITSSSGN